MKLTLHDFMILWPRNRIWSGLFVVSGLTYNDISYLLCKQWTRAPCTRDLDDGTYPQELHLLPRHSTQPSSQQHLSAPHKLLLQLCSKYCYQHGAKKQQVSGQFAERKHLRYIKQSTEGRGVTLLTDITWYSIRSERCLPIKICAHAFLMRAKCTYSIRSSNADDIKLGNSLF